MEWKNYIVTVNFGFIGCSEEYEVYASSEEQAREEALQLAYDNLYVEEVETEEE